MAVGERIHFLRILRGMTQKYLGQAVGFPEKSADVRLAQYENGTRTPKQDLINAIANELDVSALALNVPDIDSELGIIHTLFAIEDIYGASVKNVDGEIHVCFSQNNTNKSIYDGLSDWAKIKELLDKELIVKEHYDSWRYNYPKSGIDEFYIDTNTKTADEQIAEFEKVQYKFYSEHPEAASKEYLSAHPEILNKH